MRRRVRTGLLVKRIQEVGPLDIVGCGPKSRLLELLRHHKYMEFVRSHTINSRHVRMARAGLGLTIRELAEVCNINKATIVKIEAGISVRAKTLEIVRLALEERGAVFLVCPQTRRTVVLTD